MLFRSPRRARGSQQDMETSMDDMNQTIDDQKQDIEEDVNKAKASSDGLVKRMLKGTANAGVEIAKGLYNYGPTAGEVLHGTGAVLSAGGSALGAGLSATGTVISVGARALDALYEMSQARQRERERDEIHIGEYDPYSGSSSSTSRSRGRSRPRRTNKQIKDSLSGASDAELRRQIINDENFSELAQNYGASEDTLAHDLEGAGRVTLMKIATNLLRLY